MSRPSPAELFAILASAERNLEGLMSYGPTFEKWTQAERTQLERALADVQTASANMARLVDASS